MLSDQLFPLDPRAPLAPGEARTLDEMRIALREKSILLEAAKSATVKARDAAALLADRAGAGEVERRQLGIGSLASNWGEALSSLDHDKATAAKFRRLKRVVVRHLQEFESLTARLDDLGRKNVVTKEDLRKLRELRDVLHDMRVRDVPVSVDE